MTCVQNGDYSAAADSLLLVKECRPTKQKQWRFDVLKTDSFVSYLQSHPVPVETENMFMKYYVRKLKSYLSVLLFVESINRFMDNYMGTRFDEYENISANRDFMRFFTIPKLATLYKSAGRRKDKYEARALMMGVYAMWRMEPDSALPYLKEAYSVLERTKKPNNLYRSLCAYYIGDMSMQLWDYGNGEYYLSQATQSADKIVRTVSTKRLGDFYMLMGDAARARENYLDAAGYKQKYGRLSTLQNLSYLYYKDGDLDQASHYLTEYKKALLTRRSKDDVTAFELTDSLKAIDITTPYALSYAVDYDSLTMVDAMIKRFRHLRWRSSSYVPVALNLGQIFIQQNKFVSARSYLEAGYQQARKMGGTEHPEYTAILNGLVRVYEEMEMPQKSEPLLYESFEVSKKRFVSSLSFMSTQQRENYWNMLHSGSQSLYPAFSYRHYEAYPVLSAFAYNNELFTKGLLLSSSDAIRRSVLESGDSILQHQWYQLTARRQTILQLRERDPQSELIPQYEQEAENLEKSITKSSAAYREDLRQWNITWDSVKAALKPDQVAIEYMTAPLNEDSTVYCALLLRDTCSAPILIPLFEEKEVAGLLNTSTADSADIRRTYAYADNGKKLSTIIWQHITPYLNTDDEVFFSPTGVLHQIAIENLPFDSSRIMAEAYQLVRLSSTRELVLNKPSTPHEKAALYGNIYYTADEATMLAYHQPYEHIALSEDVLLASNTRSVQRGSAKNLPGTKKEIDSIAPILQKKHVAVQIYTAYEANEESLKSLSGTHQNILHLATHGFYWPDSTAQKEKYFTQRAADHDSYLTSIDPLERCGLLFAGANNAYTGHRDRVPEKVQDGILTAKEISLLDFRKADVVVLSACETGLGDISGDGVFGLQRAFKMAGAQTLLMALWQVSDDATQRLMTAFYRHMSDGLSKREAFRRAQQEVRNYTPQKEVKDAERGVMQDNYKKRLHPAANGRTQPSTPVVEQPTTTVVHPYASPYYWAGFVLLD